MGNYFLMDEGKLTEEDLLEEKKFSGKAGKKEKGGEKGVKEEKVGDKGVRED